jgi:alcohol dehydrogenase class IV
MTQELHLGRGAVRCVSAVLRRLQASRVFLVTGQASYAASGAEVALASSLAGMETCRFSDFDENPKLPDVLRGIEARRRLPFDAVVAVGGGSALDVAKLVNMLSAQDHDPLEVILGRAPMNRPGLPVIAVPTTAGSGSEATHFAVVYIGSEKYSLAHPQMLPDVAVVDPDLTFSLPPRVTAVTGLDAFAQAVESYWSVHSTPESRADSRAAIALVLEHLVPAVTSPGPWSRHAMSQAAYLAGRAINVTKTTGAHALAYPLTSFFGVPHGHAVALTLGELLVYNSYVTDADVADPRGVAHVRGAVGDLVAMLGCATAGEARLRIASLVGEVGLESRLSTLGMRQPGDLELVVRHLNAERMKNNPRVITAESAHRLLKAVA